MKTFKILVSSNAWEYAAKVLITANTVTCDWDNEENKKYYTQNSFVGGDNDGNVIVADGVRIVFPESFEFHGEVTE